MRALQQPNTTPTHACTPSGGAVTPALTAPAAPHTPCSVGACSAPLEALLWKRGIECSEHEDLLTLTLTLTFNLNHNLNPCLAAGMDAMTHAVEAYVSTISTPITGEGLAFYKGELSCRSACLLCVDCGGGLRIDHLHPITGVGPVHLSRWQRQKCCLRRRLACGCA